MTLPPPQVKVRNYRKNVFRKTFTCLYISRQVMREGQVRKREEGRREGEKGIRKKKGKEKDLDW